MRTVIVSQGKRMKCHQEKEERRKRRRKEKKEGLIANSMVHWTQFERMRKRERKDRKKTEKSVLNIQRDIEPNGCNSVTDIDTKSGSGTSIHTCIK